MSGTSRKTKELFVAALKLAPDQWDGYLAGACGGDDELSHRVRNLLDANAEAGSFLEPQASGPVDGPTREGPTCEGPGTIVGPYKLLEQIGEGGFGLVFMAEQQQPVRRKVAVKVLKPGMDTRQVIARFEAERQALALMDHAHIARVIDAGETAAGRPYFAMELVRGIPMTDYCDTSGLTPRQRLELFLTVCYAVQHAHHKGIIHRDIKPTNILVTLHDGAPLAKVIDFGIAKALGQQLTDKTLHTGFAQLIGTPLYMSPEQAEMSGLDVDTRSDVYSLGVLLYELLTGTTPFDKERLRTSGYEEILRIIREEEAAKPSTRLSTMGAAATVVCARRRSDPIRLSQSLRGELDWIVMKALEKERGRRYESAAAFAADVERYLRDEPVAACPPSAWYRFGKRARRNKWSLVTVALVSLALVMGTALSLHQAIRATGAMNAERLALLHLGEEQQATRRELGRTRDAERKATLELFEALLAQARANRLSRRTGQRFGTLDTVRKAIALARQLGLSGQRLLELRNEAIAALALPDLRVAKEWPDAGGGAVSFDSALERYARDDLHGNLHVRQAGDGREIYHLADLGPGEHRPVLSGDGRYLAAFDPGRRSATVRSLTGSEPSGVLDEAGLGVYCFSPDSRQLAVQLADGSIGIFDLDTSTQVHALPQVPRVRHMRFDPLGGRLAMGSPGRFFQVVDLATGKVLWQKDLKEPSPRLDWHPDGNVLALTDGDAIALWDLADDKPLGKLAGVQGGGANLTFDPGGALLASHGSAGILRLWDPLSNRQLFSTPFRGVAIQFSGDSRYLAASQHETKLQIWEIAAGHEYRTLIAGPLKGKRPYGYVAISPSGRFLAAAADGRVDLWNLPTGKKLALLMRPGRPPPPVLLRDLPTDQPFMEASSANFVAFENSVPREGLEQGRGEQRQDETLLTAQYDGLFRHQIRSVPQSGAVQLDPAQRLPFPGAGAHFAQSRDGRVLVAAQSRGAAVWHADQPDKLITIAAQDDVRHVAVSPDGRWVATGRWSYSGTAKPGGVKLWEHEASTEGPTYTLVNELSAGKYCQIAFSSDGQRLLTTGVVDAVHSVRRWKVETWVETPFQEPVEGQNAAFSPDGKLLVVETGSGVARLLDAETGGEYARLEDPDQHRTNHFAFTPDGTKLACASGDGSCVHVWDLQAIRRQLAEMGLDWEERRKDKG